MQPRCKPKKAAGFEFAGLTISSYCPASGFLACLVTGDAHTTSSPGARILPLCCRIRESLCHSVYCAHRCAGQVHAGFCEEQERCVWAVESRRIVICFSTRSPGQVHSLYPTSLEIAGPCTPWPRLKGTACQKRVRVATFFLDLLGYYMGSLRYTGIPPPVEPVKSR